MNFLSIQVQPDLLAGFHESTIEALRTLDAPGGSILDVHVDCGEDSGPYINVTFATPDPKLLWPSVRETLVRLGLQSASIATCTGSHGWDDYLLLHHFDPTVPRERPSAP